MDESPDDSVSLELDALLGRGTSFQGRLAFDGRTRIDGRFEGDVVTEGTLVLGDGCEVDATIDARVVIVRGGVLRGIVRATESIEVYASARVVGALSAPEVSIEKGAIIEGSVRMGPVEAPAQTTET
jgi:cytoskeletal protein CcmA (bactofilin family)